MVLASLTPVYVLFQLTVVASLLIMVDRSDPEPLKQVSTRTKPSLVSWISLDAA